MKREEVNKLGHGLFTIYWKSGGQSLAAVGSLHDGTPWFAATNWTAYTAAGVTSTAGHLVERMEKHEE